MISTKNPGAAVAVSKSNGKPLQPIAPQWVAECEVDEDGVIRPVLVLRAA